jgi:hypothetical protein
VPLVIFQTAPAGPNVAKSFICEVVLPTGSGVVPLPEPLLLNVLAPESSESHKEIPPEKERVSSTPTKPPRLEVPGPLAA